MPDWQEPAANEARQASQVRTAADLRSALEAARRALPGDAPQLHALAEEVRVSCSVARRPDASSRRVDDDPNREPWISELMRRCAGLLDSDLDPPPDYGPQSSQRNAQVPDWVEAFVSQQAALDLSWRHLRDSTDASLLAAALRYLLEHDALPTSRIFVGLGAPAPADIDNALRQSRHLHPIHLRPVRMPARNRSAAGSVPLVAAAAVRNYSAHHALGAAGCAGLIRPADP